MKKKIIFATTLPILTTALLIPPIASIIQNDVVPQMLANNTTKTFVKPTTYKELIAADVNDLMGLEKYDSREYGIVTPVKDQRSEGLCWAYSTAATSETSLLREGLAPILSDEFKKVDIDEHNIDYGTNYRVAAMDRLGLNPNDNHTGTLRVGGVVQKAMNALSMWNAPIDSIAHPYVDWNYMQPDYYLESTERIPGTETYFDKLGIDGTVKRIKKLIAQYGAVTCSYSCNGTYLYTNTNYRSPGNAGHAVSIIGWDDTIEPTKYAGIPATVRGGWLCKNSWGDYGPKPEDRYFYISYDSPIFDINAVNYVKANTTYHNNYYYDASAKEGGGVDEGKPYSSGKQENGAIFPVKRANFNRQETLKAVNVGVIGDNPKITVDVYTNVQADFANATNETNDPTRGTPVAHVVKQFEYPGYKLIELPEIPLEFGTNFSIVVKVENSTHDAELLYSNDNSSDNMTFYKDRFGDWINPMTKSLHCAARIKAFTSEVEDPTIPIPDDLKYAHVTLDKNIWEYGDQHRPQVLTAQLGNKTLTTRDYELIYDPLTINLPRGGAGSVSDLIGHSTVTLKGKGDYEGTSIHVPYQIEVGDAPDLQGLGYYDTDYRNTPIRLHLNVKRTATKYADIDLPRGFEWKNGDINTPIQSGTCALDLQYVYKDRDYYYITYWNKLKIDLNVLPTDNLIPTEPHPLPEVADPSKPTPLPPPPVTPTKTVIDKVNDAINNGTIIPNDRNIQERDFNNIGSFNVLEMIQIPTISDWDKKQLRVVEFNRHKPTISFKVTNGSETSKLISLTWYVITPAPTPSPTPTPTPAPTPTINHVYISSVLPSYHEGDMINVQANVEGIDPSLVLFEWTIEGTKIKGNGEQFSFKANKEHNGKKLNLVAKYNDTTKSTSQVLTVNSETSEQLNHKSFWSGSTFIIVLIAAIVGIALITILLAVLLHKKRR